MNWLSHLSWALLAEAGPVSTPAQLSDLELIGRYPLLKLAAGAILALGLAADVALLAFWIWRARTARGEPGSFGKAPPLPARMPALTIAIVALVGMVAVEGILVAAIALLHVADDIGEPLVLGVDLELRVGLLLGLGWYLHSRGCDWRTVFGTQRPARLRGLLAGAVAYFALLPPLALVMGLSETLCRVAGIPQTPQPIAELLVSSHSVAVVGLIVALAMIAAPLFEEVVFRGLIYPALKQRWGPVRALVVVSAAFALIHLHAPSIVPLFALGLALGLAYEVSGSLLTPIALHALFNTASIFMLLYVRGHP